jgi:hypothetical protein
MAYFRETRANLEAMAASARAVALGDAPPAATGGAAASTLKLDPEAVAEALAEAMKSDNSTTQAIAIRANNLSTLYPDKAA